jgi:hypothetical protein
MNRRPQANHAGLTHARLTGAARACRPTSFSLDMILASLGRAAVRAAAARHWPFLLLLLALGSNHAHATDAARDATEASIKAAYLYKFAAYVEWPPAVFTRADAPFVIGIVGADDIAAELNKIKASAASGSRAMEVKVLRPGDAAVGVHILFFGQQDSARLGRALAATQAQPLLTVTENGGGLAAGSIINFVTVSDRIRFEVSLPNAERNKIKVSVRLLNVALRVEARKP